MVKVRIENETKEQKFKRIASRRTQRILNDLRLLGNCSRKRTYSYTKEDVRKIFTTIERELRRVKSLFEDTSTEFILD